MSRFDDKLAAQKKDTKIQDLIRKGWGAICWGDFEGLTAEEFDQLAASAPAELQEKLSRIKETFRGQGSLELQASGSFEFSYTGFDFGHLISEAGVVERTPHLVTKYPEFFEGSETGQEEVVKALAEQMDPTGDGGKYIDWIIREMVAGHINTTSQYPEVKKVLTAFESAKNSKGWPADKKDIGNKALTFEEMKKLVDEHGHLGVKTKCVTCGHKRSAHGKDGKCSEQMKTRDEGGNNVVKPCPCGAFSDGTEAKPEPSKVIYDKDGVKIFEVYTPEAAQTLCNEGWCTGPAFGGSHSLATAADYLSYGPLIRIDVDGEPWAQLTPKDNQMQGPDNSTVNTEHSERVAEAFETLGKAGFTNTVGKDGKKVKGKGGQDLAKLFNAGLLYNTGGDEHGDDRTQLERWDEGDIEFNELDPENMAAVIEKELDPQYGREDWDSKDIKDHLSVLFNTDIQVSMELLLDKFVDVPRQPELEQLIIEAEDHKLASAYAESILKARWPQAEHFIKGSESEPGYEKRFGKLVPVGEPWMKGKEEPYKAPAPEETQLEFTHGVGSEGVLSKDLPVTRINGEGGQPPIPAGTEIRILREDEGNLRTTKEIGDPGTVRVEIEVISGEAPFTKWEADSKDLKECLARSRFAKKLALAAKKKDSLDWWQKHPCFYCGHGKGQHMDYMYNDYGVQPTGKCIVTHPEVCGCKNWAPETLPGIEAAVRKEVPEPECISCDHKKNRHRYAEPHSCSATNSSGFPICNCPAYKSEVLPGLGLNIGLTGAVKKEVKPKNQRLCLECGHEAYSHQTYSGLPAPCVRMKCNCPKYASEGLPGVEASSEGVQCSCGGSIADWAGDGWLTCNQCDFQEEPPEGHRNARPKPLQSGDSGLAVEDIKVADPEKEMDALLELLSRGEVTEEFVRSRIKQLTASKSRFTSKLSATKKPGGSEFWADGTPKDYKYGWSTCSGCGHILGRHFVEEVSHTLTTLMGEHAPLEKYIEATGRCRDCACGQFQMQGDLGLELTAATKKRLTKDPGYCLRCGDPFISHEAPPEGCVAIKWPDERCTCSEFLGQDIPGIGEPLPDWAITTVEPIEAEAATKKEPDPSELQGAECIRCGHEWFWHGGPNLGNLRHNAGSCELNCGCEAFASGKLTLGAHQDLEEAGWLVEDHQDVGEHELTLASHPVPPGSLPWAPEASKLYQVGMNRKGLDFADVEQQGQKIPNPRTGKIRPFVEVLKEWINRFGPLMVKSHNDDRTEQYFRILGRLGMGVSKVPFMGGETLVVTAQTRFAWKLADGIHGKGKGDTHDYDFNWDYEISGKSVDKKLKKLSEEVAAKLMADLVPKIGLFVGFETEYLNGISTTEGPDAVAVYVNGTSGFPMIGIDLAMLKKQGLSDTGMVFELTTSIAHELAHAIQESEGLEYDEDEAEDFGRQYASSGHIYKFWTKPKGVGLGGTASLTKLSYVAHVPGHKNSKGEAAPWVIKSHESGKILSSHKSESAAKSHLQDMHAHG